MTIVAKPFLSCKNERMQFFEIMMSLINSFLLPLLCIHAQKMTTVQILFDASNWRKCLQVNTRCALFSSYPLYSNNHKYFHFYAFKSPFNWTSFTWELRIYWNFTTASNYYREYNIHKDNFQFIWWMTYFSNCQFLCHNCVFFGGGHNPIIYCTLSYTCYSFKN